MLSTQVEVLEFIREFEMSAREYLLSKGTSEHEFANAYLDLQWNFLREIMKQNSMPRRRRQAQTRQIRNQNSQATIA